MRHRRNGYFRICRIALTERDELAFSRALTERFGKIYCLPQRLAPTEDVPLANTIGAVPGESTYVCVEVEDWRPTVRPFFVDQTLLGYFRRVSPFHFHYERSHWSDGPPDPRRSSDPPYLIQTKLEGYVGHADPMREDKESFLADVFRCLAKVGRGRARAGGTIWGHDAIRDALARGPRGAIDFGFRPRENWKFPANSPYYQDELWNDDPSAILPYEVCNSKALRGEMSAAEYNVQRNPDSEYSAKAPARTRNKLGNLRLG